MCEVATALSLASTASAVGGSALSFAGQGRAASQTNKYQNTMFTQAAESAYQSYIANINQTNRRLGQEAASTGSEAAAVLDTVSKAQGSSRAMAGSSGVRGNSVEALIREYDGVQASSMFDLNTNLGWLTEQAQEDIRSARADAQSRIEQFRPNPVSSPSALALGLNLTGDLAKGGMSLAEIRRKK